MLRLNAKNRPFFAQLRHSLEAQPTKSFGSNCSCPFWTSSRSSTSKNASSRDTDHPVPGYTGSRLKRIVHIIEQQAQRGVDARKIFLIFQYVFRPLDVLTIDKFMGTVLNERAYAVDRRFQVELKGEYPAAVE